jgi:hypothetical protein
MSNAAWKIVCALGSNFTTNAPEDSCFYCSKRLLEDDSLIIKTATLRKGGNYAAAVDLIEHHTLGPGSQEVLYVSTVLEHSTTVGQLVC